MKDKIKYLGLLLILPLFTMALSTGYMTSVYAASPVCGDRLCSEIPGGRAAYEQDPWAAYYGTDRDDDDDHMERDHDDDDRMEKDDDDDHDHDRMSDKDYDDHMKKDHMDDDRMERDHDRMMDDDHMGMKDKDHMMMDDDRMMDKDHMKKYSSYLKLSRANVETDIPLVKGYYEGEPVYHIVTEASGMQHVEDITADIGWQVEYAPILEHTPHDSVAVSYYVTNGIEDADTGYVPSVFTATPDQPDVYSALTLDMHATWVDGAVKQFMTSEQEILDAVDAGMMTLENTGVIINMPHIVWPGGQMMVKDDKTVDDHTPYGGGQILDIDTDEMEVTFIAHRGWGPDGRTIYYILTDLTPSGPAEAMGVVDNPRSAELFGTAAAVDLYQFTNGLKGTGPLGFQPGIASGAPGDANYSPMWRIHLITWNDPSEAVLLETIGDINYYRSMGMISIEPAMPMDQVHVVNCPFIDPFQ